MKAEAQVRMAQIEAARRALILMGVSKESAPHLAEAAVDASNKARKDETLLDLHRSRR
jgi:hypothetical protein